MKILIWSAIIIVIGGGLLFAIKTGNFSGTKEPSGSGIYDAFAQCITDSGAKFYGAFWCPHCQDQKKEFGDSAHLLPYVECSTSDSVGQTQECKDKGITGYPTWIFKDGSELSGKVEMKTLAEKTACILPVTATTTPPAQ